MTSGTGAEPGLARVDARGAQGVQAGDQSTQINYFYNGTWTDSAAPPPLISMSGEIAFPYRGLRAFGEQDAALFFGREGATTAVLDLMSAQLAGPGLVVVSGVSGAGKSSLLRAGVLPRLRGGGLASAPGAAGWPCVIFTPSSDPLGELAVRVAGMIGVTPAALARELAADPAGFALAARQAALAVPGGPGDPGGPGSLGGGSEPNPPRMLIMLDQSEQLFTRCGERDRHAFITALYQAATTGPGRGSAALVVLAVRADFEARLAEYRPDEYPLLARAVQDRYLLTSMTERQLRMAITEPAALAGSSVEGELTAILLAQARAPAGASSARPGAAGQGMLPLLSYALDQSWRHRTGQTLTLADYERTGGIQGAVAASAQRAYDRLTAAQQDIARRVFIRLTATSDDGLDTVARVARDDLTAGLEADQAADVATVLETFAAERLLTLDAGTVEISHEALLTAWPLLRDTWLAQTHEDRLIRTRLNATAREWANANHDASYLYSGSRLEAASGAADRLDAGRRHVALSQAEREFLDASRRAARRRTQRGQGLIALLLALVTGLAIVAVAAIRANQSSSRERDIAISGQLASDSEALGVTDATAARQESLAARAAYPTPAAQYAMADAAASPQTATIDQGYGPVKAVAFSPDGKLLATVNNDGSVRLWNLTTGRQAILLPPSSDTVYCEAFSPSGDLLAAGDIDGTVWVWNVAAQRLVEKFNGAPNQDLINSLAFSPHGKILASGAQSNGSVRLFNLASGRQIASLPTGTTDINAVAFTPDGRTVVATAGDGTARMWNIATRRQIRVLPADGGSLYDMDLAISPDGRTLATGGAYGTRIWDVATGHLVSDLPTGTAYPIPVAFSPDSKTLATADPDGTIRLWNTATGQPAAVFSAGADFDVVSSVAFSPDGTTLATGGQDDAVRLWNLSTEQPVRSFPTSLSTQQVAFGPHGATVATGDADGAARLWNVATGRLIRAFPLKGIQVVALSPDGRLLAAGGNDGTALWDTATGRLIHSFPNVDAYTSVVSVAFSPDGRTLAIADFYGDLLLWNTVTHRRIFGPRIITSDNIILESLAFSPDGRVLAFAEGDGTVRLWDVSNRKQIRVFSTGSYGANTVAFSPDGSRLSAGDMAGTAWVWNASSGRLIDRLFTGSNGVGSVAFSPDGKTLATADGDNNARLWNIAAGKPVGVQISIGSGINQSVAFSPDGTALITAAGPTRFWNVSYLQDPLARLCALNGGTFTHAEWAKYVPAGPVYRNVCAGTS